MGVTLRVIGSKSHVLGDQATRVFTSGGKIGRAASNDWVLPDPERFISSDHAEVVERPDGFYLVDLSINGTYLNSADQPIGHGNSQRLGDGDRIRIGEYEIIVSLSSESANAPPSIWPGIVPEPAAVQTQSSGWSFPSDIDPLSVVGGRPSVDPLDHLGGGGNPGTGPSRGMDTLSGPDRLPQPSFDGYVRPRPVLDPSTPGAPLIPPEPIPEDPFDLGPVQGAEPFDSAPAAPGGIPEDWDKTTMPAAPAWQKPAPAPAWQPSPPPESSAPPAEPFAAPPADPFAASPAELAEPTAAPVAAMAPRSVPPLAGGAQQPFDPLAFDAVATGRVGGAGGLEELFQAAGLDAATARAVASPENARVLGAVLRVVTQGMMEILSARAEIKNQFRVAMTQISPVENNPLKFSVNHLDAMQRLFVNRTQGFLGPVEAFDEAFKDTKAHQMAMMAGLRAAFDHLMQRFDPNNLQKEFDRDLRRPALLQSLNKTKYWDMLIELYDEVNKDTDANFSRLFGDEFARAYEEQMALLGRGR